MNGHKGWTLLELLVVIALVALLLSISLPALRRARGQAQGVVCLSRLRQLGSATAMWADTNAGSTFPSSKQWQVTLRLHSVDKRNKILFCPLATRFVSEGGQPPFAAYNAFSFGAPPPVAPTGGDPNVFSNQDVYCGYGSYGLNGWASNPPPSVKANPRGFAIAHHWRQIAVSEASAIPLLADAFWVDAFPHHTDPPGSPSDPNPPGQMSVFYQNRHAGHINVAFLDLAARRVRLEELWRLKWHRNFDTNAPIPAGSNGHAGQCPAHETQAHQHQ